jgi:hypothetical protein
MLIWKMFDEIVYDLKKVTFNLCTRFLILEVQPHNFFSKNSLCLN